MKTTTPVNSIRKYCIWCCIGSAKEIRHCTVYECPLYAYRMGKKLDLPVLLKLNPEGEKEENKRQILSILHLTPVKAIRKKCKYCAVFELEPIRKCEHTDCDLFAYRMGTNPSRKGIGNKSNPNLKNGNSASLKNSIDGSEL